MFTKNSLATLFNSNLIVSYWRKIQWKQTEQKVMTRLGAGFLVLIPLVLTILVGRFVYIWVEDFTRLTRNFEDQVKIEKLIVDIPSSFQN